MLKEWVLLVIDAVRSEVKSIHSKPPYTARLLGIIGVALAVSLRTVNAPYIRSDRVPDGWDVGSTAPIDGTDTEWITAWHEVVWASIALGIANEYVPSLTVQKVEEVFHRHLGHASVTDETRRLMLYLAPVIFPGTPRHRASNPKYRPIRRAFAGWKGGWDAYLARRRQDGWLRGQDVPVSFPNQSVRIPVGDYQTEEDTDLNQLLEDPSRFCLLAIYDPETQVLQTKQSYLGPRFGEVDITGLVDEASYDQWKQFIQETMPSEACRRHDLEAIMTDPDETGKCRAELWAGSFDRFYNPPSQLVWITVLFLTDPVSTTLPLQRRLAILASVMIGLFVVAVVCWDLKYTLLQPRPIQDIRRWYPDEPVSNWAYDGGTTGRHWLPYQDRSSVTPPFPDMPSGHACFSSVTTHTLRSWLRSDACFQLNGTSTDLRLLSPLRTEWDGCTIRVPTENQSLIETGVPSTPVVFPLLEWSALARDVGRSRVDGGIHTNHTNQYSQDLGGKVARFLIENFFSPAS